MKGHNEKCISIFQKYNKYNKDIVKLSIDTLSGEERIILKKRYGESYLETGYILKSEEAAYEDVERKFLIRLKEVDELIKNGKTKQQILDYYLDYSKKSSFSYYSSYTKYSSQIINNKLGNSFIENFPILIRSVIKKILPQMSVEEKSLVNLFYWGHDYDVLRKDIDNDKIKDLKALINKLKDDAIKIYQHKATIPNHNTLKESTKTNITTNNPKKIANINIKNNNSLQKKIKSRKLYEEKDQETVLKIIDRFKVTNPDYYEIISKKYSGDKFEIKNDVKLTQKEQIIFNNARTKIKLLLNDSNKLNIFLSNNQNGFLKLYEEKDQETVLKIVDRFKVMNPNYYEIISKKYSGDRFEIKNDVKLTQKEQKLLKNAKAKIKLLLNDSKKLDIFLGAQEGFLQLYEEKDQETVLKIVNRFKVTSPDYYEVISKKYSGDKFEIKNDVELTYEEQKLFNSAKSKIKLLLNDSKKLDIFLGAQEGFLQLYEEKDQETVLKIVNRFKVTSPDYYEVISKKYSGDKFEIKNDVELTYEEQKLFNSAKAKIKILLNDSKKLNIFLSAQNGFLQLYEEKDQETVLKIVDSFKVMNPNYYEIISKKYSGDRFEIKNVVKLTKKEHTIFSNAKVRINSLLTDKQKLIILLAEKQDLILEKQEFKCKFDEKNLNLYISNLDKISNESAIEVITQIAKYYPNKIIDIINSNYIKNKLNYLTQKEQAYIYLNLLSYNIPSLTKKKISQILDVEELFLDEYQIMTSNDDVNELNKLIKK